MNSRLNNAEERLEKALARVDAAIQEAAGEDRSDSRVVTLERENEALRRQHGEIVDRLDSTIERLQRVLRTQ